MVFTCTVWSCSEYQHSSMSTLLTGRRRRRNCCSISSIAVYISILTFDPKVYEIKDHETFIRTNLNLHIVLMLMLISRSAWDDTSSVNTCVMLSHTSTVQDISWIKIGAYSFILQRMFWRFADSDYPFGIFKLFLWGMQFYQLIMTNNFVHLGNIYV